MWVQLTNMDENLQVTAQLITWGLGTYRNRVLAENVISGEQILNTAITQGQIIHSRDPLQANTMCINKAIAIIESSS